MFSYDFKVADNKKYRIIIHTDCKNEADDQYTVAHALMTQKVEVRAIIAAHFEKNMFRRTDTMQASFDEIVKVVKLMGVYGEYEDHIFHGAKKPLVDERTPQISEGAWAIIEEALREDDRRLFILLQGGLTDLASAILMEPEICGRMTAIWNGGAAWPDGGAEFNLCQDVHAANVVFGSKMEVWQIPMNAYNQLTVSLAELQLRVKPYGEIGKYLFEQLVELSNKAKDLPFDWPHGENWVLGDEGVLGVLLEDLNVPNFEMKKAPLFADDMTYMQGRTDKEIRVYHTLNARLILEDFYARLALNFPRK